MAADTREEYCKGCARNEKRGMIQVRRVLPGGKKKKRTIKVHSALHFCTRLLIAGWRRKRLNRPTIPGGRVSVAPSGDNRILLRAGG
ncbi:hypothetical protein C3433_19415 [Citrobacter freundii]|uniref:Uncharacterized protein n=1 Tax=Citrobacter arsenatis TaxID=2546350 RepID=A0A4P6WGK0_9ENTR|nr:hypothetical protein C3433_19415 [Citrobacter freundii]QBM22199.1 hypothetical protein E1B03_06995 [Citrobacter arsenatis]